jgi:hypothetical protein
MPSTIEIDAKTAPTMSTGWRNGDAEGVVLPISAARGLVGFSNGRCGILVRQVYDKQNRAASRPFGLSRAALPPIIRERACQEQGTESRQ